MYVYIFKTCNRLLILIMDRGYSVFMLGIGFW